MYIYVKFLNNNKTNLKKKKIINNFNILIYK